MNFEEITLRSKITSRGGGIEIDLTSLGYPNEKMSAYQNYLGGGILGRILSDCTLNLGDPKYKELLEVQEDLKRYFHSLTNPEEGWGSLTFEQNQKLNSSAY